MRITLLSVDPGHALAGPQRAAMHLRAQAGAWLSGGHSVTALLPDAGPASGFASLSERGLETRVLRLPVSEREIDWHLSHVLPDLVIEQWRPDAPHGARACAEIGVPHFYEVQGARTRALESLDGRGVRADLREGFAASAGSICDSESVADWVRARAPEQHATMIDPGSVPFELLRSDPESRIEAGLRHLRLASAEFRVGFSAAGVAVEDLLTLIEAAGSIRTQVRIRLVGVGDALGGNEMLRCASGVNVGLMLCGAVPAEEQPRVFALCDAIVVVPTRDEGSVRPQEVIDALSIGRPVVAGATSATKRLIRSGQEGLLVEPGDVGALGAALSAIARDPSLAATIGFAGRKRVSETHSHERSVARILEFLDGLKTQRRDSCGA